MFTAPRTALLLLLSLASGIARAETAELAGRVLGPELEPLADVQVTLYELGAVAGRTALTDAFGNFALTDLPPGSHELVIEEPGFASVPAQLLRLHPGQRVWLRVDLPLAPGRAAAGSEPSVARVWQQAIDPSRLGSQRTLTDDWLRSLPVFSGVGEVNDLALLHDGLLLAPGLRSFIDGFPASDPIFGRDAGNLPLLAVDQVTTRSAGVGVEWDGGAGSSVRIDLPRGGDAFHFDLMLSTRPEQLHFERETGDHIASDEEYYQVQLLGTGPLLPGKLWFVAGARVDQGVIQQAPRADPGDPAGETARQTAAYSAWRITYLGKLTWQPTTAQGVEVLLHGLPGWQDNVAQDPLVSTAAEVAQRDDAHLFGVRWTADWTPRISQRTALSYAWHRLAQQPMGGCRARDDAACRAHVDVDTGLVSVNSPLDRSWTYERQGLSSTIDWRAGEWLGSHLVSLGADWSRLNFAIRDRSPGGGTYWDRGGQAYRLELESVRGPVWAKQALGGNTFGAWLQDRWRPVRGLIVVAGLRLERLQLDENTHYKKAATTLDPRLMLSWDPADDGRWAIRLGVERTRSDEASFGLLGLVSPPKPRSATWEFNPITEQYDLFVRQTDGAGSPTSPVPGSHPAVDGAHLEVEWEALPGTVLRATALYRRSELGPDGLNPITWLPNDPRGSLLQVLGGRLAASHAVSDRWRLRAAYALLRTALTTTGSAGADLPDWLQDERTTRHTLSLLGVIALPHQVTLSAAVAYVLQGGGGPDSAAFWTSGPPLCRDAGFGRRRAGCAASTGDQVNLDARLTWDLSEWTDQQIQIHLDLLSVLGTGEGGADEAPVGAPGAAAFFRNQDSFWLAAGLRYWY